MKMKKIIGYITLMLFLLLSVYLIIQLVLKLTEHSPTDIQVLYTAMGVVVSYLLFMSYKMGTFVGETKEFIITTKNSFSKLREDIRDLRKEIKNSS